MGDKQENKTQSTTKVMLQDSYVGFKSLLKSSQPASQQPKTSENKN
ncbi:hypothetical protein [Photobacterium kishitanii]|nr:hypothetical protein [Photobacterium kishitanii]